MKKQLGIASIFIFCCMNLFATNENSADKIKQFLTEETPHLSQTFPYRINLPTDGQIAKNNAGVRIAENAQQLFSNNKGQLFYYDLYDHAMRVPHWHANATEVGVVLQGKMRITIWQGEGKAKVFTVEKNGTWTIPAASLHSLENVGPTDLTFLVGYNMPNTADRDFVTAWAALPDAVLERSVGLTPQQIASIKKATVNRLSQYDASATPEKIDIASPFTSNFSKVKPLYDTKLGSVRRIDASNAPAMKKMALQQTILKPGSMREPHWYLGGNDFFYVYKGTAFFTMMDNDGKVFNVILKPGDLVYIPVGVFHSYVNVGDSDLEVYETFDGSKHLKEITLLNGAQQFSPETLASAIGISKAAAQEIINKKPQAYITKF